MSDHYSESLVRLGLLTPTHARTHERRYLLTSVNHIASLTRGLENGDVIAS